MTIGCSAINGTFLLTPTCPKLGTIVKERTERRIWHGHCTYEHPAAVATCTKSMQDQASRHSNMDWRMTHERPPLAEKLSATDGCWKGKSSFSLGAWPLLGGSCPTWLSIAVKKAVSNCGRKGCSWLTHPSHSLSQVKAGTQAEQKGKAAAVEEHCLLDSSSRLTQLSFLFNPGPPTQRWHCPPWVGLSHISH